jgi:hypothetical protein
MSFQPKEEKEAERQLIRDFAKVTNSKVIKLQGDNDDGGTDGVIKYNGKEKNVEARRKGYPNHSGKVLFFEKGWNSRFLGSGIFLNELTIKKYKDKGEGFIFLVDIKGFKPRCCIINNSRVDELLRQPYQSMRSTNSHVKQSVKTVPLDWFKEYY